MKHSPGRILVGDGEVTGVALVLPEPLSLWGGLDPTTGRIIDQRHPSCGACVTDRLMFLPRGRGSSSASSILLESVRLRTAPVAILTLDVDPILALGAAVSCELYRRSPTLATLPEDVYYSVKSGAIYQLSDKGLLSPCQTP